MGIRGGHGLLHLRLPLDVFSATMLSWQQDAWGSVQLRRSTSILWTIKLLKDAPRIEEEISLAKISQIDGGTGEGVRREVDQGVNLQKKEI